MRICGAAGFIGGPGRGVVCVIVIVFTKGFIKYVLKQKALRETEVQNSTLATNCTNSYRINIFAKRSLAIFNYIAALNTSCGGKIDNVLASRSISAKPGLDL